MFPVPVAARTTVAPLTGLSLASRAVTVMTLSAPPGTMAVGSAATVERTGLGGPGRTSKDSLIPDLKPNAFPALASKE